MELRVTGFSAGYGADMIVKNISFSLPSGTLTALIGTNGCGKTTLLKGLCRLIPHRAEAAFICEDRPPIDLNRCSARELSRYISYIPQRSSIHISLPVLDIVMMGFQPFLPLLSPTGKSHQRAALAALRAVGIEELADRDFLTLSEGQKQLCILARSLVQNTKLLLFDEPDSALDYPNRCKTFSALRKLIQEEHKTALLVLHDLSIALDYCDQLLLMRDGSLLETLHPKTDSERVLSDGFSKLYGPVEIFRHKGHCFILAKTNSNPAAGFPDNS